MHELLSELPWVQPYLEGLLQDPTLPEARRQAAYLETAITLPNEADELPELAETLAQHARLVIRGEHGAGKTTLLRALLFDYARRALGKDPASFDIPSLCKERRIPLYVDLAGVQEVKETLRQVISIAPAADHLMEGEQETLGQVPLLLLLDHAEQFLQWQGMEGLRHLRTFVEQSPPSWKIVLTLSREHPSLSPWDVPSVVVSLLPLSKETIVASLCNTFGEERALELCTLLTHHGLWSLASLPRHLGTLSQLLLEVPSLPQKPLLELLRLFLDSTLSPAPPHLLLLLEQLARRSTTADLPRETEEPNEAEVATPLDFAVRAGVLTLKHGHPLPTFAHPLLRDFFLARSLQRDLESGGLSLEEALVPGPQGSDIPFLFLYGMTSRRQSLLTQLLQHNTPESLRLAVAMVTANEPRALWRKTLHAAFPGVLPSYSLGLTFKELGCWEEAHQELEEALHLRPDRADLQAALAETYAALGRHEAALRLYERLAPLGSSLLASRATEALEHARAKTPAEAMAVLESLRGELQRTLAKVNATLASLHRQQGALKEAQDYAQQAVELDPSPSHISLWGSILQQEGQAQRAFSLLQEALQRDAHAPEVHIALGNLLEERGELTTALRHYEAAQEVDPQRPEMPLHLGRLYRLQRKFLLSRSYLEETRRRQPHSAPVYAELSRLAADQGHYQEAVAQIRRALDEEPQNPLYHYQLGMVLKGLELHGEAAAALRKALSLQPQEAAWHNQLGVILLEGGEDTQALQSYEQACALVPDHPLYRCNLGIALLHLGEEAVALEAFAQALHLCEDALSRQEGDSLFLCWIAAEVHHHRGLIYDRQGRYSEALEEFQRAAIYMPDQVDHRLREAMTYGRFQRGDQMVATLRKVVAMRPKDAVALHQLGQAYEAQGQIPEATEAYHRAVQIELRAPTWLLDLGRAQRRLGHLAEAISTLTEAVRRGSGDAESHHQLGLALEEAGNLEEALEVYRRAVHHDVQNPRIWLAVGRASRRLGRPREAQSALRTALSQDSSFASAYSELARTLASLGRYQEALEACHRAMELEERNPWHAYLASTLYRSLARDEEALRYLERAVALEPGFAGWHLERGHLLERLGRKEEAKQAYERARGIDPTRAQPLAELRSSTKGGQDYPVPALEREPLDLPTSVLLAETLLDRGEALQAHQLCAQALERYPQNPRLLSLASCAAERLGELEEARSFLERAFALQPNQPEGHRNLASLLLRLNHLREAETAYRRAQALEPQPGLWADLGRVYYRQGRFEEAVRAFQSALGETEAIAPDEQALWYQELGDALRAQGDLAEAAQAYDRAMELAGERATLRRRRGELLIAQGQYREAIGELLRAQRLGEESADLYGSLSLASSAVGDRSVARKYIERACSLDPSRAEFQRLLGMILRESGDLLEAMAVLREAVQLDPTSTLAYRELGLILEAVQEDEEAIESYRKALSLDPRDATTSFFLGRLLLRCGRTQEALPYLEAATREPSVQAEAWFLRGQAQENLGDTNAALACLERAISLDLQSAGYVARLGLLQRKLGLVEEAIITLRRALVLEGSDPSWYFPLGELYEDWGRYDLAAQAFQSASAAVDRAAEASYRAGLNLWKHGDQEAALAWFQQAVARDPEQPAWWETLGTLYRDLGQLSKALQSFQEAQRCAPQESRYPALAAGIRRLQGHKNQAAQELERLAKRNPSCTTVHQQLGLLYAEEQRWEEAEQALVRALDLEPENFENRRALAEVLHREGRHPEAIAHLDRLAQGPRLTMLQWVSLAEGYEAIGAGDQALFCYRQALAQQERGDLHYRAGRTLLALGRPQEAVASLRQALERNAAEASWHNALGEALDTIHDYEGAIASFRRALELDPTQADYYRNLGVSLERQGHYGPARQALREALQRKPGSPDILRHLEAIAAKEALERGTTLRP